MAAADEKLLPAGAERKLLEPPGPPRKRSRRLWPWILGGVLLLFQLLFLFGFLKHRSERKSAEEAAQRQRDAIPQVNVARVESAPGTARLELPGNIAPLVEAYIYARSTGYVRKRYADIGDQVRAGQVLADVESPDLDEQVVQAQAQVTQAEHQL